MSETNEKKSNVIDVFISYSSNDSAVADQIAEGLADRGVNCWKAGTYTINSGEDFREKISNALDECKIFLIILSESSMSKPWVRIELTEALRRNKKIYSLRIDKAPLDELFEFKLGCSQISDGSENLVPVLENLAINIKKDRDAWLEKKKSDVYSQTKTGFFFDFAKLNGILTLLSLLVILLRMHYVYTSPILKDDITAWLEQAEPIVFILAMSVFVHCVFQSYLKNYTNLGCTSAQYLTFKRLCSPLKSNTKKQQGIVYLQRAADGGNYRAQRKLASFYEKGKHVKQNSELAKYYIQQAKRSKEKLPLTVKNNIRSFVFNVFFTVLLFHVYYFVICFLMR